MLLSSQSNPARSRRDAYKEHTDAVEFFINEAFCRIRGIPYDKHRSVNNLRSRAFALKEAGVRMPQPTLLALESCISLRSLHARQIRSSKDGSCADANRSHDYFLGILENLHRLFSDDTAFPTHHQCVEYPAIVALSEQCTLAMQKIQSAVEEIHLPVEWQQATIEKVEAVYEVQQRLHDSQNAVAYLSLGSESATLVAVE